MEEELKGALHPRKGRPTVAWLDVFNGNGRRRARIGITDFEKGEDNNGIQYYGTQTEI